MAQLAAFLGSENGRRKLLRNIGIINYPSIRSNIPEDLNVHQYSCENLKCHRVKSFPALYGM
jgi:hypothetical protein